MRVFLTGATGFIGSRVLQELLGAGHQVLGLACSDTGERWLETAGGDSPSRHAGRYRQPRARSGAGGCRDPHGFRSRFSRFADNCEKDRRAIGAMADAFVGSDRPLIITSSTGIGFTGPGRPAVEQAVDWNHALPRIAGERAGAEAANRGVSVAVVRLPQVHNTEKQGLISPFIEISRAKGLSAYVRTAPIGGPRYMSTMLRGSIGWPSSITRPASATMPSQKRSRLASNRRSRWSGTGRAGRLVDERRGR